MLGRVRACSLSSLEVLEMERTPSKLLKNDSLSIYETTLMKLKQGSQRELSLTPEDSLKTDTSSSMANIVFDDTPMGVNTPDYSTKDSFPSSADNQSIIISKEKPHGNLSVLYLFSKYRNSRNDILSSPDERAMAIEDDGSSVNTSQNHA